MAKRVVITPSMFKLSKAGFDADTAAAENILFDGMTGSPYAGVYLAGASRVDDGTWATVSVGNVFAGQLTYTRLLKTINFTKTFSQPPQVLWTLQNYNDTAAGGYNKYSYVAYANNYNNNYVSGLAVWASCSTTALTLRVDFPNYGAGSAGIRTWNFAYMVFQT